MKDSVKKFIISLTSLLLTFAVITLALLLIAGFAKCINDHSQEKLIQDLCEAKTYDFCQITKINYKLKDNFFEKGSVGEN